jgi:rfaE bifunctional protein nucleotidyltransferase chain/domain
VSDYGRGATSVPALRDDIARLSPRVPVVWDPHPRGSRPVPGARLVSPNEAEARIFTQRLGLPVAEHSTRLTDASRRADALVEQWRAQAVAVTLGDRGALLAYGTGTPMVSPAPSVLCLDPCGAGDRFAVGAALALRAGLVTTEAVQLAVDQAALYVASGGPASLYAAEPASFPTSLPVEELVARVTANGGTVVATGGCFDLLHAGHVATLRAARGLGDCLVVCLNSDDSVRRLKGMSRPLVPAADRARVLEALEFVDAVVVFEEDTPAEVLRRIRPHVWAKGGDYAGAPVPEAIVLEEWGGQAVVLRYIEGRSTTNLVQIAAEREARSIIKPEKEIVR